MILESIASGVAVAGIFLAIFNFGVWWQGVDEGSTWGAFKTPTGLDWPVIVLTMLTFLTCIAGVVGFVIYGFTIHWYGSHLTAAITLAVVTILTFLAGTRKRKAARKKPTTTSRARSAR